MAESQSIQFLIKLFERQGLFEGDLCAAQKMALIWLMGSETKETLELEKIKLQSNAMATNPLTQNQYLKQIFGDEIPEEEPEFSEEGIEWVTPESQEELKELEQLLMGK